MPPLMGQCRRCQLHPASLGVLAGSGSAKPALSKGLKRLSAPQGPPLPDVGCNPMGTGRMPGSPGVMPVFAGRFSPGTVHRTGAPDCAPPEPSALPAAPRAPSPIPHPRALVGWGSEPSS